MDTLPRACIVALLTALPLSSCNNTPNGNAPQESTTPNNNVAATPYPARLLAMPESQQMAEFSNAAQGAREHCNEISAVVPPDTNVAVPIWTITCSDGGRLAMVLSQDRIERVLRTRPATPAPQAQPCARLLGGWTNGSKTIHVTQEGANFLIAYQWTSGSTFRFVGPCENDRIITHTDWVGDLAYIPSSNSAIFERMTFYRR